MFLKRNIDHLEEIFLRQFEEDDGRILYRKNGRGAPIPVSLDEREAFRSQYRKASIIMIWGPALLTVAGIVLSTLVAPNFIDEGPGLIIISLGLMAAILVLSVRNTAAPARALERRSPVGNELSKDEWHSKHFATTSWPLLGSIFLMSIIVCVSLFTRSEFREWSDYLWTIGSGILSILGARALWLKYRLSRGPN